MGEKQTLIGVAATLALLGAVAVPGTPLQQPTAFEGPTADAPGAPDPMRRDPRESELAVSAPLAKSARQTQGTSVAAVDLDAVRAAARAPLRLAIEAATQPLVVDALRAIGRGPDRADWAGGAVLDAVDRVLDRRSELAIVAREPTASERTRGLGEFRLGDLVLAVIVHPRNELAGLPRDRMRELLRGGIGDWSALGGVPGRIRIIAPAPGPTGDLFARIVIAGDRFARDDDRDLVAADVDRVRMVAADPHAISVVPLGIALASGARILRVDGEAPGLGAVRTGRYPFACPVVLCYADSNSPRVSGFITDLARPSTRDVLLRTLCLE